MIALGRERDRGAAGEDTHGGRGAADRHQHRAAAGVGRLLAEYGEVHGPKTRRPDLIGFAIAKLLDFFGDKTAGSITRASCDGYVDWRVKQSHARTSHRGKPIKPATARRELVVLSAALRWCWKEGKIDRPIPITLPPQAGPRERHLSRSEVAALIAGALGWDQKGVRHRTKINRHLARFILLALYTGTRHDAILRLQWTPNTIGGWIDLDAGVIYRKPMSVTESVKRRPPVPIPPRLVPHLRRWRKLTARYAIEYAGRPIQSKERRAWRTARELAGLGSEVTPHVLRHTCATMLLQLGVSVYDVAVCSGRRKTWSGGQPGTTPRTICAKPSARSRGEQRPGLAHENREQTAKVWPKTIKTALI
jgi:integrase